MSHPYKVDFSKVKWTTSYIPEATPGAKQEAEKLDPLDLWPAGKTLDDVLGPLPTPTPPATRHKVIITGRGQAATRNPTLLRLRPEVVAQIKELVDGPLYLTVELALRHYAKMLKERPAGEVEMIKAADLG